MNRVFKTKAPEHMFYEMFLDEHGAKISKSKGQGLTVESWLRYGSQESLRYLMLDKPKKAKELSLRIIPRYMEAVRELTEHYYADRDQTDSQCKAYKLISFFHPPAAKPFTFDYSLLCNLIGAVGAEDTAVIKNYVMKISPEASQFTKAEIQTFIDLVRRYYRDVVAPQYVEPKVDTNRAYLLRQLYEFIEDERSDEEIHTKIYEIARSNNFDPKEFFSLIYKVLIRQERGPRLGNFINILGKRRVREVIRQTLDVQGESA
jgi:lysyl-tRNA synthetase class 1